MPRKFPVSSVCPMRMVGMLVSVWMCRSCCGLSRAPAGLAKKRRQKRSASIGVSFFVFIKLGNSYVVL